MKPLALSIAALAACFGVVVGLAGPDTTPVDPAPYLGDGGNGDGDGDGDGGRGGR